MSTRISLLFLLLLLVGQLNGQSEDFSNYNVDTLLFNGHTAYIVKPSVKNLSGKWIWRARFWGHQGQTDIALIEKGYHLVYVDVAGLFGNRKAVDRWNKFYRFVKDQYDLHEKVALEGMSRGGMIVYNWAAENSSKVACIYADAPVCDLRSWPGGKFSGKGSEQMWKEALEAHEQTEESINGYQFMPIYTGVRVAKAGIPSLNICGGADEIVPYAENTKILAEKYKKAGGSIEVIVKEGIGHHPHSLEDPSPIVKFIEGAYEGKN